MRHPPQQRSLSRCRCHRLPPARKRKGCGGDFRLRCPWAGRGRWRPWCCCGRGWRGPAAPRWVSARRPRSRLPQRPALTCPDTPSPFSPQLSSGGALAAAPRSWRPLPIGAPRPGKATVRPSRDTVRPAPRGSPRRGWVWGVGVPGGGVSSSAWPAPGLSASAETVFPPILQTISPFQPNGVFFVCPFHPRLVRAADFEPGGRFQMAGVSNEGQKKLTCGKVVFLG